MHPAKDNPSIQGKVILILGVKRGLNPENWLRLGAISNDFKRRLLVPTSVQERLKHPMSNNLPAIKSHWVTVVSVCSFPTFKERFANWSESRKQVVSMFCVTRT